MLTSVSYRPITASGELLAYVSEPGKEQLLMALNLGVEPLSMTFSVPDLHGRSILSTFGDRSREPMRGEVDLRPHEGIVVELANAADQPSDGQPRRSRRRQV
jgi:alpha-glucosidase